MSHQYGEGYSAHNPVPTVQGYQASLDANKTARPPMNPDNPREDKALPPMPAQPKKEGADEKQELMNRMQPPKQSSPLDMGKESGGKWVKDPITGGSVQLRDPDDETPVDNAALDPTGSKPGPSLQAPPHPSESEKQQEGFTTPPAQVGNICLAQFPPPVSEVPLSQLRNIMRTGSTLISVLCAFLWVFFVFRSKTSWGSWFIRSTVLCAITAVSWIGAENNIRKVEKTFERVRADMVKRRGEEFSPPTPESVEWLNAILRVGWGLVNPEMFVGVVDMVEDILQASLPSFIDAVRISDVGQGTNPVRIVSMRALRDDKGVGNMSEKGKEEWFGKAPESETAKTQAGVGDAAPNGAVEGKPEGEGGEADQESSQFLNFEVTLSYQALPNQSSTHSMRTNNIHLMLEFFAGAFDWFKIPIPIYCIVESFGVTVRARVGFGEGGVFVRTLTISLMGVPQVEVSVEPFTKALPNVLDLPFIKKFVEMGIAAACAQYLAPQSLTINLAQILAGATAKKDTVAMGVVIVTVHHAVGLSAQDAAGLIGGGKGTSDPYVVVAFAKFGKPVGGCRIVEGDLNPVWEETTFMLVTEEEVKGEEDICVMLWDSDKSSADDLVGRVVLPLADVMKKTNRMTKRTDKLQGFEDANDMPGEITWSVGYFDKMPLNQSLKKSVEDKVPEGVPQGVKDKVEDKPSAADTQEEADAMFIPPDPEVPSGILSVIIHQINNLERQDIKGNSGSREGQAGQDTSIPSEQSENLPSSYCELIVNDDLIYKTRVKQFTSMPYFEAGTERFVRDWKNCCVRVQVRDSRVREKDPVLGVVSVQLDELFKKSSEITRFFALQEGVGYGRAYISFLFRQIKTPLPRSLLGWDTGTAEILGPITLEMTSSELSDVKKLTISTSDQERSYKIPSGSIQRSQQPDSSSPSITWDPPVEKIRLPVYNRYSSAILFELSDGGLMGVGVGSDDYFGAVWLKDVEDDEETEMRIPVLKAKDAKVLRQNYINDETKKTHVFEVVGWLKFSFVLDSGLDPDHEEYQTSQAEKHRFEAYDRVEGQAAVAERTANLGANGEEPSKQERKEVDAAKKHQLEMRHRGVMQYKPVRTAKWSKEGIKARAHSLKNKITGDKDRDPVVESEVG
ncbi:hypothetical protein ABKN59_010294 [Abortiporus biennis]